MFFLKNRNIVIFIVIAALMLWANISISQTKWEKYLGNPTYLQLSYPYYMMTIPLGIQSQMN